MSEIWTHPREKPKRYREGQDWPAYRETKLDGLRVTFFKQPSGELMAFGRKVEPHLELMEKLAAESGRDWLWRMRDHLPPMSSVDGELYLFAGHCTDVKTAMIAKSPELKFAAFAVPYWNGDWMGHQPISTARSYIQDELGLIAPAMSVMRPEWTEAVLLAEAEKLGIEGWVLKSGHYHNWWKVKRCKTVDAIVMGIKPGTGKYHGMMGALEIGLYAAGGTSLKYLCRVGTGFSDELRRTIKKKKDIGRVCEVEYAEVAANGGLFHPRFVQWRDDKPRLECTSDQLETGDI